MSNPLVTVIIPAYNHEQFIAQSIRSVINQDYENIELVILNDGSRDKTHDVICTLVDECRQRFPRFEYINKANEGLAKTLNRGVLWAHSDYITTIASDDLMKPCKVSCLLNALVEAGADVGLAYADAEFISDEGQQIGLDRYSRNCEPTKGWDSFIRFDTRHRPDVKIGENSFDYKVLLRGNFLPAMSVMWRRSVLTQVGMFTPGVVIEDWDLWMRLARTCQGVYVDKIVASYRWHDSNTVKTMVPQLREGKDSILMRELTHFRHDIALSKTVARLLIVNALKLIWSKRFHLAFSRLFDLRLWRCALFGGAKSK